MQRKKVVTIGGGTGSFMLLSGLKNYPINISAIVSMADDGGSTGVLRDELGVLPPGDVRQCLVALSESSDTLRNLLNYRFEEGSLKGHNFGNLFLSALEKISGSFDKGVGEAIKILNVKGEVLPVSDEPMRLLVKLKNGDVLEGESKLDDSKDVRNQGVEEVTLEDNVVANSKALERMKSADLICIGPGDHFGTIIPNLLVDGVCEAITHSKAKIVYNCNLTNKQGQTEGFTLDDYVDRINSIIGKERIDYVTFNVKEPHKEVIERYEEKEGKNMMVLFDESKKEKRSYKIIKADLLRDDDVAMIKGDPIAAARSFIRHDSNKLAKLMNIMLELGDFENIIKEIE